MANRIGRIDRGATAIHKSMALIKAMKPPQPPALPGRGEELLIHPEMPYHTDRVVPESPEVHTLLLRSKSDVPPLCRTRRHPDFQGKVARS